MSESNKGITDAKRLAAQRIFFYPTERFCQRLAGHISLARRKRRWTQKEMAARSLVSLATYQRIEKGDSSVAFAAVMRVLFVLDGLKSFDDVLAPEGDELGREEVEKRIPQRIRKCKKEAAK